MHSPQNLQMAIRRMPRYLMLGRSQKNYWLPLRFQPPILLHPLLGKNDSVDDYDMTIEAQKWERLKQNHGYFNYRYNEPDVKIPNDLWLHIRIKNL